MTIFSKPIFFVLATFSLVLFYGCSGHALQDLVDGKTTSESSSEHATQLEKKTTTVPPSQNNALNSISPSGPSNNKHAEHRYIQKGTNAWIKNEWEPLTESNTSSISKTTNTDEDVNQSSKVAYKKTRTSNDINSTGLQYYVDKAEIYVENRDKRDVNKTKTPSHAEKMNAMPGIGKTKGRR